jgi:excisionase family DNA binding protein
MSARALDLRPHLTVGQLAERYGVSVQTVYDWRKTGHGPAGMKVGRYVRYSQAEIERFEAEKAAEERARHAPAAVRRAS